MRDGVAGWSCELILVSKAWLRRLQGVPGGQEVETLLEGEEEGRGGNRECRQKRLVAVVDCGLQVLGPWGRVGGGYLFDQKGSFPGFANSSFTPKTEFVNYHMFLCEKEKRTKKTKKTIKKEEKLFLNFFQKKRG